MQQNSSAHAANVQAASSSTAATKSASVKAAVQQKPQQPVYQVKGSSATAAPAQLMNTGGGAFGQTSTPNAPSLSKMLGTAEMFSRPLNALPMPQIGTDNVLSGPASSTSPSPGPLFAEPLFKGLLQRPDGSPEDLAELSNSASLGGSIQIGASNSTSIGGGPGLLFGPLGGADNIPSAEGQDQSNLNKAAQSLKAGQISTGFLPLVGSSMKLGGPPPLVGFGAATGGIMADQPQSGECITGTYATYRGPIDLMVPRISQDFDKDTLNDLNVSKAKKFRSQNEPHKNLLIFLAHNARNISFVINQEELCENVLSISVMEQLGFKKQGGANGSDTGIINDFTFVDFQYLLVLMGQGNFLVFDCAMVLDGSARQPRFVNQDVVSCTKAVPDDAMAGSDARSKTAAADLSHQFTRIDSLEFQQDFDPNVGLQNRSKNNLAKLKEPLQMNISPTTEVAQYRRVLLYGKLAHRMHILEFPCSDSPDMDMMEHPKQNELQIPSNLESRPVLDVVVMASKTPQHVAILFSDNIVTILDTTSRTFIFRTRFNDATDNISQMFFVAPRHLESPSGGQPRASQQSTNITTHLSFFLLVETKLVSKDANQVKRGDDKEVTSVVRTKHLRKLHLVQAQQIEVSTRSKFEKRDRIEQIDALTFGEETPKLIEFVRCYNRYGVPNYFAFLLTRERIKSNGLLKMITVKMRWAPVEESKADDNSFEDHQELEEPKGSGPKAATAKSQRLDEGTSPGTTPKWKLKFDYVTSLAPNIANFRGEKHKPTFLNVIEAVDDQFDLDDDFQDDDNAIMKQKDTGEDASAKNEPGVFFIYTGVGSQSVVFKRKYSEISEVHADEATQRQQIEEARVFIAQNTVSKKSKKKARLSNYDEMREQINKESQREKEQRKAYLAKQAQSQRSNDLQINEKEKEEIVAIGALESEEEDPAILLQSQPLGKKSTQQNPEQQMTNQSDIYKKKAAAEAAYTAVTTNKPKRPGSAKKSQATQQAIYKTKGKQETTPRGQTIENVAGAPESKQRSGPDAITSHDSNDKQQSKQLQSQSSSLKTHDQAAADHSNTAPNARQTKNAAAKDSKQGDNSTTTTKAKADVAASVSVPASRKQQQEQIIDNYQELNRKFAELHTKMNSLQQQVKAQKDLQVQVEQTIAKAVKSALPEIVKKQVEETVQPLMQKQTELLDLQVRQHLLPKIDALSKLAAAASLSQIHPVAGVQSTETTTALSESSIRKLIIQEFKQAMQKEIIPQFENELKQMLSKVREPIANVNKILYETLVNEEQKNDHMVQVFEQRLQMAQSQYQQQPQFQPPAYLSPPAQPQMQHAASFHHQSFSLQPQASQTSLQPVYYHTQPQLPQYVQVPPQHINQQQLFNVSFDAGMATNGQQQQAQIMTLQPPQTTTAIAANPSQTQTQSPATATFYPQPHQQQQQQLQTAFGLTQHQQPQFVHQTVQQQQQQQPQTQSQTTTQVPSQQVASQGPTMVPLVMQVSHSSQQPQLQPTNTSFVPTAASTQPQLSQVSTGTMQQNLSAPNFTPQTTGFQPTNNTIMMRPALGLGTASYIVKPTNNLTQKAQLQSSQTTMAGSVKPSGTDAAATDTQKLTMAELNPTNVCGELQSAQATIIATDASKQLPTEEKAPVALKFRFGSSSEQEAPKNGSDVAMAEPEEQKKDVSIDPAVQKE